MLIGLSLSFCVSDIINGLVNINDVAFIICGTRFRNPEEFEDILDCYARNYWSHLPQLGRFVATRLHDEGRLLQPRLEGCKTPHVVEGHWATVSK